MESKYSYIQFQLSLTEWPRIVYVVPTYSTRKPVPMEVVIGKSRIITSVLV